MDDELPRVSPSLLRDPAAACPRRLALAHRGHRQDHRSDARWAVADALAEHARLAQLEERTPDPGAFDGVVLATPEQHTLYEHAVRWYLVLYGDRPARAVDLGEAQWGRDRPDLGVRLTSRTPLVFETQDAPELRVLRLAGDPAPRDLLDDDEVAIDVLRLAGDVADGPLRVCVSDLVRGELTTAEVSVPEALPRLEGWVVDAVAAVRSAADANRPCIGADCSWCAFVAGCPAHAR